MTIYCDIDGTLTDNPRGPWGNPNTENIAAIRSVIAAGHTVIMWSATGEKYAKEFSKKYDIQAHAMLGKPDVCFDDWLSLRPSDRMKILPPEKMWQWATANGVPREAE